MDYGGGHEPVKFGKFGSKGSNFNWQFCAINPHPRLNVGKVGEK